MEQTVSEKLDSLLELQRIDSSLDEIKKIRGALPEEVEDLEDEITGFNTRIGRLGEELETLEQNIEDNKNAIKEAEGLIKRYEEQQMNVRNNREYDAISKEIELQKLEIQICEKRIKEGYEKIEDKKKQIEEAKEVLDERNKDLESKKQELDTIINESKEEEEKLNKEREKAAKKIDTKLLKYYEKLRANLSNGMAVVTVRKGAAEGCNIVIPPQRIAEIRERKKIVIDEYSGRILAGVEDEIEEEPVKKPKRGRKKTTK